MAKQKKFKSKEIGRLDKNLCKKYNLPNFNNIKIVQSLGLVAHIQKHLNDFISVDSFNMTITSVRSVIEKPYFVYYDSQKNSIKFYKRLKEYVCVVVNITSTEAYVATIYPVNKRNIDKLKNKL